MTRPNPDTSEFSVLADAGPRRSWLVGIIAAVGLSGLLAARPIAGWDIWWHLGIGREALQSRAVPSVDSFSYTHAGEPYAHTDVLADSILFLAFDRFDFIGLAILKGLLVLVALWGMRRAGMRSGRPAVWILTAGAFVVAVQDRIILRPLLFSIAAFPLMIGLIERARYKLDAHGNRPQWEVQFVALLPAIALQWAWLNCHRGGILGLVLLGGHACALLLAAGMSRVPALHGVSGTRPTMGTVGIAFVVTGLATAIGLLNPSGLAVYSTTFDVAQSDAIRTAISEWAPLTLEMARDVYPVASVLVVLATLVLVVRLVSLLRRRAEPGALSVWHAGLLIVFCAQTAGAVRWMPYLAAVAAVVLMRGIDEAIDDAGVEQIRPRRAVTLDVAATALVVAGLLHFSAHTIGLGEIENRYPKAALDTARELELGPRVHNTFVYGGYIIWDGDFLVAIDGRNDMVYPGDFFLAASESQHSLERFAEVFYAHPADWVLADNSPGRENFQFLAGHPDWMAVHWSEEAVIYVLRPGNEHLERHELQVLDARSTMGGLDRALRHAGRDPERLRVIREELQAAFEHSPRSLRINTALARFYHHTGQPELMERAVSRMESIAPGHPAVEAVRELIAH